MTPFSTLTEGLPFAEGQATWTSLPRAARPSANRSANFAAPLTSGAYVSAGMRIRRFGVGRCADRIQLSSVSVMVSERRAFLR